MSSSLGLHRRSHHWKFPDNEIDVTIEKNTIRVFFGGDLSDTRVFYLDKPTALQFMGYDPGDIYGPIKKWAHESSDLKILSMFQDTSDFINFVIDEHKQLTEPGQIEFQL